MSKQVVAMSVRVDTASKKYANFAVNAPCSVSTEIANFLVLFSTTSPNKVS